MSIMSPILIYSPTRVLQGVIYSATHFQAVRRETFQGKVDKIIQWTDYLLLLAE